MIKPLFQLETQGQIAMGEALNFALRNKRIVFVKDNHGSGFHFYLKKFNSIYPDLRIAQFTLSNKHIFDCLLNTDLIVPTISKSTNGVAK